MRRDAVWDRDWLVAFVEVVENLVDTEVCVS